MKLPTAYQPSPATPATYAAVISTQPAKSDSHQPYPNIVLAAVAARRAGKAAMHIKTHETKGRSERRAITVNSQTLEPSKEPAPVPVRSAASDVIPTTVALEVLERKAEGLAKMVDRPCCSSDWAPLTRAASTAALFSHEDQTFLRSREEIVSHGVAALKEMARALAEIHAYKNGLLWRGYGSFAGYCREKWDYQKAHSYRMCAYGAFLIEMKRQSPTGDCQPEHETQIRPIVQLPAEHRVPCWLTIVAEAAPEQRTAKFIADKVREYLAVHPEIPRRGVKSSGRKTEVPDNAKTALAEISTVNQSRDLAPQRDLEDLFQEFYSRSKDLPRAADIQRLLRRVHGLMYAPPPPFEETKDG